MGSTPTEPEEPKQSDLLPLNIIDSLLSLGPRGQRTNEMEGIENSGAVE